MYRPVSPVFSTPKIVSFYQASRSPSPSSISDESNESENEIDESKLEESHQIDEYLRKGDVETIKVLCKQYSKGDNCIDHLLDENTIIDCSKGLEECNKHRMEIYGSIIRNRFKSWRIILEHLSRDCTDNEKESIIRVANALYKDINWNHTFWKKIASTKLGSEFHYREISDHAKKWIKYRTH